jgi:AraC-like DNA-binding protein
MAEEKGSFAKKRMVKLLESLATSEVYTPSLLEGVVFIRMNKPNPRTPVTYDPSIIIVAQGQKKGYQGDQVFTYNAYNYLVLSVPLPFECETEEASPEKPLLAVSVKVDTSTLVELLMAIDENSGLSRPVPRGFYATPLTDELVSAVVRLLECLRSPIESRILGPQIIREIIYRVLYGQLGGALRALAARHSSFSQIARTLNQINMKYPNQITIESLAREAHMSVSTFHHNFKAVTAVSPLQYLKSVRLHKARILMIHDGLNASTAADRVGYQSASQFSREFKRFFGNSPLDEVAKKRARNFSTFPRTMKSYSDIETQSPSSINQPY